MTRADQAVDKAADKLETFVDDGRAEGGIKGKAADQLAEDPAFLRKLKPSLITARVKGETPPTGAAPAGPQLDRPKPTKPKNKKPMSPFLVVGLAFAVGYTLAKVIDWRGHAHPRR